MQQVPHQKRELTQALLKEYLSYEPETGNFTWSKQFTNRCKVGSIAGTLMKGYIRIGLHGQRYDAHRLAWLYVYGKWPKLEIDHINHYRADNRINNLREATHSQNNCNVRLKSNNTSGYKGVSFNKKLKKWQVTIEVSGKSCYGGIFGSQIDAAKTYDRLAKSHYGEFAYLNFPEGGAYVGFAII